MYRKDNPDSIKKLFASIANRYDLTNSVMSLGLHKLWNNKLVRSTLVQSTGKPLLDLCCGTGEITYTFLNQTQKPQEIHMIDFCDAMLNKAKERANKRGDKDRHRLVFTQGDAQNIPLPSNSINAVSIAYGIRNVQDPRQCLQEVHRVLDQDGIVGILELTRPSNPFMKLCHSLYLKGVLPLAGKMMTDNKEAYEYLMQSIGQFIDPRNLGQVAEEVGFRDVVVRPLTGGIAHLITARK